jgi:hypothetical protein
MYLDLCFGAGSALQSTNNAWAAGNFVGTSSTTNFFASNNNLVCVTGLVVLPGAHQLSQEMSPMLMRPFGDEVRLCQRHFTIITNTILADNGAPASRGIRFQYTNPVKMRAAPTAAWITLPSVTNGSQIGFDASVDIHSIAAQASSSGGQVVINAGGIYSLDARLT